MDYHDSVYRDDVTEEARLMYGVSDIEVYEDEYHNCLKVMLGWSEVYSVQLPWDDVSREDMRRHAYVYKNDTSDEEVQSVKDFHDRLEAQQQQEQDDMTREVVDDVMQQVWHGRIPGVIHPGLGGVNDA